MSSVMRCRRDVIESSFCEMEWCCKQLIHRFAWEFSEEGRGQIRQGRPIAFNWWCYMNTAKRVSPRPVKLRALYLRNGPQQGSSCSELYIQYATIVVWLFRGSTGMMTTSSTSSGM